MPIEGVCPSCGARFDLAHALQDGEARQALAAALSLPAPLARLIVPYLSLHAPGKKRIAWRKLARLLRELRDLIDSGTVCHRGETHAAPLPLWRDGLEKTLQAAERGDLILPLDGHGYLAKVVWTEARRRDGKQAAASRPLHPSHRPVGGDQKPAKNPVAIAEHLENLKRSVGKR